LHIKIYAKSVLCIERRNGLDATPMTDSGTNDRLIKCIHSSIRRVLSSPASYFVVCCFQHKIVNISKLLNHIALCWIDDARVTHLMQMITAWCNN